MLRLSTPLDIFLTHRPSLVEYASRIVGDHARAEDVVQEAYLRFDTAASAKLFDEPVGYLYRIVRNLALDGLRRQRRESLYVVGQASDMADSAADPRPTPEAEAAGRSDIEVLKAALGELPTRTRRALELHRFEGKTVKAVAESLSVSVGTAHSLIVDALEHCRTRLYRR
ncbi:MAG: sigma-70 family RNA polymerase sigma factor [Proteobacteria bacterium]|nr:sigma-70 family RNA polymerase sigma factor [Pseudomonadota bacterium]